MLHNYFFGGVIMAGTEKKHPVAMLYYLLCQRNKSQEISYAHLHNITSGTKNTRALVNVLLHL